MILEQVTAMWQQVAVWGLIGSAALATILALSQGMGLSRLSLTFLLGTFFSGDRARAHLFGFIAYFIGGWVFAAGYLMVFLRIGETVWWHGALLGIFHALFLLAVMLPLLPYIHPRMASEYDGPTGARRLEPPGFLGLNYGQRTPLTTLAGHAVYGAVLGLLYRIPA